MLALGIILVLLILLLILPVGADVRYDGALQVKLKIGVLKFTVLPTKKNAARPPKAKKEKKKRTEKQKLTAQDVLDLARIGVKALGRFRRSLSIDRFTLHVLVAADDPYDAVLRYGALNAGLGALAPPLHKALKIRSEDVRTNVDLQGGKGSIYFRTAATLQIWEILRIALCGGLAFLSWRSKRKKAAKALESINENAQEEKAS